MNGVANGDRTHDTRNHNPMLYQLSYSHRDFKCKSQMRIIAFIQDAHSIKDIMKSQGIADFRAPPPIPKFIDTTEALDDLPSYDSFEPAPDDF